MKQRRNQDKRVMTFTLLWTAPKALLAKGILVIVCLHFRRTEEIILALLDKPTKKLFDLKNPMFFDKNVFCENYINLRRHLEIQTGSNEPLGKTLKKS